MKKKPVTAAELTARLEADPEFVARRAEQEASRAAMVARLREAEVPLVQALAASGFLVSSVWDLVNTAQPYPTVLPVLLHHLSEPYPDAVREGIARAMAVREANYLWTAIVTHYRDEPSERVKHGLACAIAGAASKAELGDIIDLVSDTRHGTSRGLLLSVLRGSRDPRARATLLELRDDPELEKEIAHILHQLEKQAARTATKKR